VSLNELKESTLSIEILNMKKKVDIEKENYYWNLIKEIGWGTKTTDCDAISKWLNKKFTKKEIKEFEDFVWSKVSDIHKCLEKDAYKSQLSIGYTGDDGFDDLCKHIVGMGKEQYEKVLKEKDVPAGFEYVECFTYIFHDKEN
jgi:hypothetical protein